MNNLGVFIFVNIVIVLGVAFIDPMFLLVQIGFAVVWFYLVAWKLGFAESTYEIWNKTVGALIPSWRR